MSSDKTNVSDKIEILSTEDEKLKTIGEILVSDSSRKILQLLFNQSFTVNQLAQKTELSLPLVIHHLKKMQSSGVVKIANVEKNTKSHDMKFYTIDKVALVILPTEMSQPAKKSKSLFNSFNRIHRLATLGGVSITAWFSSQFMQKTSIQSVNKEDLNARFPAMVPESFMAQDETESALPIMDSADVTNENIISAQVTTGEPVVDLFWSAIIVLGIIVIGLSIEIAIKSSRKITYE